MKRPPPTARTQKREREESKNFLILLLVIVGVVALIQVLLFVTMLRMRPGSPSYLQHIGQGIHERAEVS
ncbi:MAG TPA: hypothetical protein VE981_08780 [Planctomycetota bacterium]|nr:hypothetical protein [Planctomycetota bacterium]